MNMTEIEARGKIKYRIANEMRKAGENKEEYEDLEIALQVMKEIREYRELGSVEELKALKEKNGWHDMEMYGLGYNQGTIDRADELQKCREQGYNKSIDEFANKLKQRYVFDSLSRDDVSFYKHCNIINKIAEQMKGGATDEC